MFSSMDDRLFFPCTQDNVTENLTLEHEASRCIVKCCKQYALTASAAQIPTTRSSDCAFPATICD